MRVRLLKSWVGLTGRKYPIGQILIVTNGLAKKLINEKRATKYTGEYPPRKLKIRTDFFKPK